MELTIKNNVVVVSLSVGEGIPVPGIPGKSAYEIALENGFEGTEAEWLESLKGDVVIVEFTLDSDAPVFQFDRRKTSRSEYAPSGDFTFSVAPSGNKNDTVIDFRIKLDGDVLVILPDEVTFTSNFGADDNRSFLLPEGVYHFFLLYQFGELMLSVIGPKIVDQPAVEELVFIEPFTSQAADAEPLSVINWKAYMRPTATVYAGRIRRVAGAGEENPLNAGYTIVSPQGMVSLEANHAGGAYSNALLFTEKYAPDRRISKVVFWLGSNDSGIQTRTYFAVRTAGNWYALSEFITQLAQNASSGTFSANAERKEVDIPVSALWLPITFVPGVELSIDSSPVALPAGAVEAFGFYIVAGATLLDYRVDGLEVYVL